MIVGLSLSAVALAVPAASQRTDWSAETKVAAPFYEAGQGPVVAIDSTHHNLHTASSGFYPVAALLEADRFRVRSLDGTLTAEGLEAVNILIIADARPAAGTGSASAFAASEVAVIANWVKNGGALLLIADHMPFPAAAQPLAQAFGFMLENSFARAPRQGPELFSSSNGGLPPSPISEGFRRGEQIDHVYSFQGSSFLAPPEAVPVMSFSRGWKIYYPKVAWQLRDSEMRAARPAALRGAIRNFGAGRVAVFSEAAMFTAQETRDGARGFNFRRADQNKQFLLNLLHWLAGAKKSF